MAVPSPNVDRPDQAPLLLVLGGDARLGIEVNNALKGSPYRLLLTPDLEAGLAELASQNPDAVLLDLGEDSSAHDDLSRIKQAAPQTPLIVLSGDHRGEVVIEATKRLAFSCLFRPFDPSKLKPQVDRAVALKRSLMNDPISPAPESSPAAQETPPALVGDSAAMQSVYRGIGRAASLDIPVLIRGEHGTGAVEVAREIHRHSDRMSGPVIDFGCQGLGAGEWEEQLFGLPGEAGRERPRGKAERAAGGTLVLREIDAAPLSLQAALMSALREGSYEVATGGRAEFTCRLIAVTTEDLEARVRVGDFRPDLFYALSSCVLTVPPLRQRPGDLPSLVGCLLEELRPVVAAYGVERPRVSEGVMRVLRSHLWPGNLDELESVLRRALIEQQGNLVVANELLRAISGDPIIAARGSAASTTDWDAFAEMRIEAGADTIHAEAIVETERKLFTRVLRHTRGNQAQAARLLGITRASLRKKLRLYGMAAKQAGGQEGS